MRRVKSIVWAIIAAMLLGIVFPIFSVAIASEEIDRSTVKAKLVTLGSDLQVVSFTVNGDYIISETGSALLGTEFTVERRNNSVCIKNPDGNTLYTGTEINLIRRSQLKEAGYISIHENERTYLGNFRFRIDNMNGSDYLQVINIVPMAYYLYGVLAGEVGNSCEPDALKAQAIAAKCYCISRMKAGSNYDIGDTSSTQVYKGYDPSWTNIIAAVDSTIDLGLTLNGKIFSTFYSATNGGETDIPSHPWSASEIDKAYSVTIDDYDFNSGSYRETYTVELGKPVTDVKLKSLLNVYAPEDIEEFSSVNGVYMSDAKYEGVTRNYETINFDVTAITMTGDTVDMTISFPVSKMLTMGIFTKSNYKIYWGQQKNNTYEIYHVRFGHGVGLSQCGANYRAKQGQTYTEILKFYYPGADLTSLNIGMPKDGMQRPSYNNTTNNYSAPATSISSGDIKSDIDAVQADAHIKVPSQLDSFGRNHLAGLGISTFGNTTVTDYAYVTSEQAQLLEYASSSSNVIDNLSYGDMLSILDTHDGWFEVESSGTGSCGYVNEYDVKVLEKSNSTVTYRMGTVNVNSVNFREKPSTSSTLLDKLTKGMTVYVWGTAGSQDGWYYVQSGLKYGYIYSPYLDIGDSYTATGVAEGSIVASGITKSNVNLRSVPSTSGNTPITELSGGTYLLIYSYENGWYKVSVNGITGYVSADYITVNTSIPIMPTDIENPIIPTTLGIGIINASDVRFRTSPDTSNSGNIIMLLQKGDMGTLYSLSNGWYYAKFKDKTGYVYAQYVNAVTNNSPNVDEPDLCLSTGKATANVNFRAAATTSSEVFEKLSKNTSFEVIGKSGDWFFIRYEGKCGFVSNLYSEIAKNGNVSLINIPSNWTSYSAKTNDVTNFRKGPSIQHSVMCEIPKNTSVTVLAVTGEWCLTSYNSSLGFVTYAYLNH